MVTNLSEITDLNNLELVAAHVTEGFITGLHKSPFHGFSSEFNEHRLYNKGESTRHIDWKLYARSEKLFVKRYEDESNLRCNIVIDTSSSMKYPQSGKFNKLEMSVVCAAALINLLRSQRDAVSVTLFDKDIYFESDCKISTTHAKMLFSRLEEIVRDRNFDIKDGGAMREDSLGGSIAKCLHQVAENTHKRSLILIFSDMMDSGSEEEVFSALQHLRHAKHDVILFHVMDRKTELNFDFENRPYKFVDMETGGQVALNPLEYKEIYRELSSGFCGRLRNHCGMYEMDYVDTDVATPFKEILAPFLIKRAVLH
ncbi:MAG: DUF58 domain-containing protein [Bacteroidales bacterium]|nr:DUF58 domain-containing protein [Bacteroidales bacterium]